MKSVESLFEGNNDNGDEIVGYERNSSDEDDDDDDDDVDQVPANGGSGASTFTQNTPQPQSIMPGISRIAGSLYKSQFYPDDDNTVIGEDYLVVGLKSHESIMIHGQCKVTIQRGAVLVNDIHYLSSNSTKEYQLLASSSQALPHISSTQVENMEEIHDTQTPENMHLFTSEYKSVIKLTNMYTGLEDIGTYYIPFKNLLFNKDQEEPRDLLDHEKLFRTYSFEIILREKTGLIGMNTNPWIHDIYPLLERISGPPEEEESKILMVIGNKNTGKSTLSKLLINSLILKEDNGINSKVCYLDLDPGQSEFSIPYCLSLSVISQPILAMNVPKVNDNSVHCKFFGYSSPQDSPKTYVGIIKQLITHYNTEYRTKGYHIVINTPGWVRGLGKELLIQLTQFIKPDHLLCLRVPSEGDIILQGLTFNEVTFFDAIYQSSRYSASQLRLFNKFTYFHQRTSGLQFDFLCHLLDNSPLRLLYESGLDPVMGINGVCVLGYDIGVHFHVDDLQDMLECSIVGLHVVDGEVFNSIVPIKDSILLPNYLSNKDFGDIVNDSQTQFVGLAIIHSIDKLNMCFNLYIPNHHHVEHFLKSGYKLILCKGEGKVPTVEFVSSEILKRVSSKRKKIKKVENIPYINFEARNRVGGAWKVRRNIKRGVNK
ncbi:Polynucleotide 5'-hydroxyl-kinase grc3 [Scheffersomyces spartinae]|uniref:Polynucleotide 5'-hydroxyl-kinase GRC3 n=1 Tax=Scheffersomyces spartinae TaxID=45513 RepID=A0A9P8AJY7_9ASCO|nr:Polynucleotide 5'-hydroxyl-kinase grc3 [Scheffersomyces spartinae]KAG7195915.1 Polynucleotide 5'-hydroxyl-kinase grc3 [Scheffersomyces spartinae]